MDERGLIPSERAAPMICVRTATIGGMVAKPEVDIEYEDWHAIHDHMSKTLRVYGKCLIRGGGFAAELEPREEQGINPQMLMLNFRLTPTGESPSEQTPEY